MALGSLRMQVGTVLVFSNLLVRESEDLVNVVEAFRINVSGIVRNILYQCASFVLTMRGSPAIQVAQWYLVWVIAAS